MLQIPSRIAIVLISLYQKTLSPDHSWLKAKYPHGFCRYYPSCSQYTKEAIVKFGLVKGGWMGLKRILKCNPWAKPSIDLIPNS
jgi:uncharacterized protein